MKVILLDYVYKHGVAGEVIDVADGFARNFLIPKKLAVKATDGALKSAAKLREQAAAKRAALDNRLNELARIIDNVELVFGRRAAVTGKLFGSVTTQEIADSLFEKTGIDINRRRISQQSIREIGTHEVPVRLGSEISPILKITVVREEELADYLASQQAPPEEDEEQEGEVFENISEMGTEILPASQVREVVEMIENAREAEVEAETAEESADADEEPSE